MANTFPSIFLYKYCVIDDDTSKFWAPCKAGNPLFSRSKMNFDTCITVSFPLFKLDCSFVSSSTHKLIMARGNIS